MRTNSTTVIEITLTNPDTEEEFLGWWDRARELLHRRANLVDANLHVLDRGQFLAILAFPLPGSWTIAQQSRHWQELEQARPAAMLQVRQGRPWRREGNPHEISTRELSLWLAERAAGQRDFVLVDTLAATSFAQQHLPGAVNLPAGSVDESSAAMVVGTDKDRPVVVYCSSYG
ncbi:MAG: rhodanese-like domain-containing protein [Pseudomonadota bacterium]